VSEQLSRSQVEPRALPRFESNPAPVDVGGRLQAADEHPKAVSYLKRRHRVDIIDAIVRGLPRDEWWDALERAVVELELDTLDDRRRPGQMVGGYSRVAAPHRTDNRPTTKQFLAHAYSAWGTGRRQQLPGIYKDGGYIAVATTGAEVKTLRKGKYWLPFDSQHTMTDDQRYAWSAKDDTPPRDKRPRTVLKETRDVEGVANPGIGSGGARDGHDPEDDLGAGPAAAAWTGDGYENDLSPISQMRWRLHPGMLCRGCRKIRREVPAPELPSGNWEELHSELAKEWDGYVAEYIRPERPVSPLCPVSVLHDWQPLRGQWDGWRCTACGLVEKHHSVAGDARLERFPEVPGNPFLTRRLRWPIPPGHQLPDVDRGLRYEAGRLGARIKIPSFTTRHEKYRHGLCDRCRKRLERNGRRLLFAIVYLLARMAATDPFIAIATMRKWKIVPPSPLISKGE
jgi:hypothetical protein